MHLDAAHLGQLLLVVHVLPFVFLAVCNIKGTLYSF